MSTPYLSILIFLPSIIAILIGFVPAAQEKMIRGMALAGTILTFLVSLGVLAKFNSSTYHFQMSEFAPWIQQLGIHYRLGVDGISIWLLVLTTFLSVICVWFSAYVKQRVKAYMALMLVLETAMLGVFCATDMILFYTFFEASLIPMWLLVAIWGGERRIYAGYKFFIFTFAGSIFMLIGMISLAWLHAQATGTWSFSLLDIQENVANGKLWANATISQAWLFWSFALAFLVKCPAFPFHTWLPDAHVEAPTAGSVILAGVLLKMGTYGFLRFVLPLFPDVLPQMVPAISILAIIGILYGAVVAAVQPDVKKLVAYSSVSHMGFVLIGIFSLTHEGLLGGAMQQLNHGISTGALFLLIGLIYERRHTRMFSDYGGLKSQMPIYSAIFLIVMLSSVGLPGTNGFIGEFLAMFGFFKAAFANQFGLTVIYPVLAGIGVILAAVYLLWMFQKMFYGPNTNPENQRLKDIKGWELAMCSLFVVLIFWGGLYPNTFLKPMEASLNATRMMALNPPEQRPNWKDTTLDVDQHGNLVRLANERSQEQLAYWQPEKDSQVVAPANFYFPIASASAPSKEPIESHGGGH